MRNGGICSMNEKGGAGVKIPRFMLAAPKQRQRQDADHLWSAAGIEKQRSAAGFIQVRTGLHRSVVSYQSSGCAIPESGHIFYRA